MVNSEVIKLCSRILQDACFSKVPDLLQFQTSGSAIHQSGEPNAVIKCHSRQYERLLQCSLLCVVQEHHGHILLIHTYISNTKVRKEGFRSLGVWMSQGGFVLNVHNIPQQLPA